MYLHSTSPAHQSIQSKSLQKWPKPNSPRHKSRKEWAKSKNDSVNCEENNMNSSAAKIIYTEMLEGARLVLERLPLREDTLVTCPCE